MFILIKIRLTCVLTVLSSTTSSRAISMLDRPRANSLSTSSSLAVSLLSSPGRAERQHVPGGLQAVHDRHPDVEHGHRGAVPAHKRDRLQAVTRLGYHRDVRLGPQDHRQA